jgi:GT2 family glycosyltransferase
MNKDSKYVLFLDDDVRLHPGTIGALTAEMVKKPEVYCNISYQTCRLQQLSCNLRKKHKGRPFLFSFICLSCRENY